jgi:poly(3-hydroxybutyrate) depolymerase
MNAIAEQHGFVVAYPEEQTAPPLQCWNWYKPSNQERNKGEPKAIAGVVKAVKARHDVTIDDNRVYVAGLSAGASMAVILGATYPDVFAAIGVVAGVPYKAADNCFDAFNAMQRITDRVWTFDFLAAWGNYGQAYLGCTSAGEKSLYSWWWPSPVPDPNTLGQRAFEAMGSRHRVMPVILFQGADDTIVVPQNGSDMVSQWAQTDDLADDGVDNDDIDDIPDAEKTEKSVSGKHKFIERTYRDRSGDTVIMSYTIDDMPHAWPGGAKDMKYSDPAGPDASALIWTFFDAHRKTGPTP